MKIEVERYCITLVHRRVCIGFGWWRVGGKLAFKPWHRMFWCYYSHSYYDGDIYTLRIVPFFVTVHPYDIET